MMNNKLLKKTVLVTGGSGFLAGWIIVKLLQQGYRVHTTVRHMAQEQDTRAELVAGGAPTAADPARLQFFAASLEQDAGWDKAAHGCDYVIHTASPFPAVQPKNEDEIIVPARDGALRVLRASLAAGISHVVMTSSTAAMEYPTPPEPPLITEDYWTDIKRHDITPYTRSKTIAEQSAWDFIAEHKDSISLSTIAPGTMIGPLLGQHMPFSMQSVKSLLDGSAPAIPRLGFGFVDVRDVADLHIAAMTAAKAKNQRLLGGGHFLWLHDVADILRRNPALAKAKIPKRNLPNTVTRLLSIFTPSLRSITNDLDKEHNYSPEKTQELLGWSMRPIETTLSDTVQSLQKQRLL